LLIYLTLGKKWWSNNLKKIIFIFFVIFIVACDDEFKYIKIKEQPSFPEIVKPLKADTESFDKLNSKTKETFNVSMIPLEYVSRRNPFISAVEVYLTGLGKVNPGNPLSIPINDIVLKGVIKSFSGSIGVVEALGEIIHVRMGDKIGNANGVIMEILDNSLKVREIRKDIYGEYHSTIKELKMREEE